ncbi:MAG: 1,4-beta-xylanase [Ruminococcaceae bacterium]|nr:1,4-beta-xylanase [Oscillospiraceae bacterium]
MEILQGADPFILLHDGKYYCYPTSDSHNGYIVYESDDLINWTDRGYCLVKDDVMGNDNFWAPEVTYYNGRFYMVYTANLHLGIAVADSPLGPFKQTEKKWLSEDRAIDGSFFIDDDGSVYLYYVGYNNPGGPICVNRLSKDLLSFDSEQKVLIRPTQEWELVTAYEYEGQTLCVTEGPFMLKHKGKYYLSYSANDYQSPSYAIGYAVSDSPMGDFMKYENNPILIGSGEIQGTGHHSFTTTKDKKELICVFHAHNSKTEIHPRMTHILPARFVTENGEDVLKISN